MARSSHGEGCARAHFRAQARVLGEQGLDLLVQALILAIEEESAVP